MSKKLSLAIALAGMCALSLFLVNCGSSSSRPSGLLYVLTQGVSPQGTPGLGNNVSSFAIDLNSGGLSLINSNASTCSTAATASNSEPCGLPLDILLDPTGATAFVLNQGVPPCPSCTPPPAAAPPTIFSYTVNSNGSLGTPTLAASLATGDIPLAMVRDAAGSLLFVLDAGTNPSPPIGFCPITSSSNSMYAGCPSISTFTIQSASLTLASGSPLYLGKTPTAMSVLTFPAPGAGTTPPCGFGTSEEFLFVTNSQDLSSLHDDNTLSVYCVNSSGTLADVTPNPPLNPQPGPLSVQAVNTNLTGQNDGGVFVYVGSQTNVTGSLSVFQMCTAVGIGIANCRQQDVTNVLLTQVGTTPTTTGQNPVGMVVDPTNQFLYVVCNVSSQVYSYLITTRTGVLSAPTNLPTGAGPVSMALHPSINNTGQFLFTSNSAASNISGFTLSVTTDSMSSTGSPTSSPSTPSGMTVR